MKLMLRELFEADNVTKRLECELDLGEHRLPAGFCQNGAIKLSGEANNRAGIVKLKFTVAVPLRLVCDRCLTEFEKAFEYEFSHILVRRLNAESDDDEYVVCENDFLDLNDLAVCDMLLSFPTKILCREDCRGLCPKCGCNLNENDCDCEAAAE